MKKVFIISALTLMSVVVLTSCNDKSQLSTEVYETMKVFNESVDSLSQHYFQVGYEYSKSGRNQFDSYDMKIKTDSIVAAKTNDARTLVESKLAPLFKKYGYGNVREILMEMSNRDIPKDENVLMVATIRELNNTFMKQFMNGNDAYWNNQ